MTYESRRKEHEARVMTPDAHMVETLRLRTAALHRVIGSNDLLRRENDDLRARLAQVQARADQCFDLDNSVPAWELRDILDATS